MGWCAGAVDRSEIHLAYEYKTYLQCFLGYTFANRLLLVPCILPQTRRYKIDMKLYTL